MLTDAAEVLAREAPRHSLHSRLFALELPLIGICRGYTGVIFDSCRCYPGARIDSHIGIWSAMWLCDNGNLAEGCLAASQPKLLELCITTGSLE